MENIAEGDLNCSYLAQKVLQKKRISVSDLETFFFSVVKMTGFFSPCLKSLPEVNIKKFILIALTKEVSKKHSTEFFFWFSLMNSILIRHMPSKGKVQNVQFKESRGTKKYNGAEYHVQQDKQIQKLVSLGQDPTQLSSLFIHLQ